MYASPGTGAAASILGDEDQEQASRSTLAILDYAYVSRTTDLSFPIAFGMD